MENPNQNSKNIIYVNLNIGNFPNQRRRKKKVLKIITEKSVRWFSIYITHTHRWCQCVTVTHAIDTSETSSTYIHTAFGINIISSTLPHSWNIVFWILLMFSSEWTDVTRSRIWNIRVHARLKTTDRKTEVNGFIL